MSKIIQTFWLPKGSENALLHMGGFVCPEIHYMSWMFSCLQLIKFHKEVELHTNQAGKEILIDLLGLPYTKVHLSLETEFINALLPSMWAYCKIHTYSLQETPFLHVDGDVFIWKPFEDRLIKADIVAQNIDNNLTVYKHCLEIIQKQAPFIPDWLAFEENQIMAYNAGIIGGNNIDFFKEYTRLAFEFYDKNKTHLDAMTKENKNIHIIPEQFLPYVVAKKWNIEAQLQNVNIVTSDDKGFGAFFEIEKSPDEENYIHLLGYSKKSMTHNDFVGFVLKQEYPEYYAKIISIYQKRGCLSEYMKLQFLLNEKKQKKILPQIINEDESYEYCHYYSKLYGTDFASDKEAAMQNSKLNDLYQLESTILNFKNKSFDKIDLEVIPFPTYKKETNVFNQKNFENYFINITPYHELISSGYNWNESLGSTSKDEIDKMNPFRTYAVLYLDVNYFSNSSVRMDDSFLYLFEKIKTSGLTIKNLLKIEGIGSDVIVLLKKWYSHGFIYFTKLAPVIQEHSEIYIEQQNNLKAQVAICFEQILLFYKNESDYSKHISRFENPTKAISLQEIIQTFQELNFEVKGVRGSIESLNKIPLPAICLLKLRGHLSLYAIITKVSEDNITIFNPEIKKEEVYQKTYFSTIWDGILILMMPKKD